MCLRASNTVFIQISFFLYHVASLVCSSSSFFVGVRVEAAPHGHNRHTTPDQIRARFQPNQSTFCEVAAKRNGLPADEILFKRDLKSHCMRACVRE